MENGMCFENKAEGAFAPQSCLPDTMTEWGMSHYNDDTKYIIEKRRGKENLR